MSPTGIRHRQQVEITINNDPTTNQNSRVSRLNQIKNRIKQNLPIIIALVGTVALKMSFDYFVDTMQDNYRHRPSFLSADESEGLGEFELVRIAQCVGSALQNNQSYQNCR